MSFVDLFRKSPALVVWDETYLGNSPPAAMSSVTIYDSVSVNMSSLKVSMRDFITHLSDAHFIFDDVPSFLM